MRPLPHKACTGSLDAPAATDDLIDLAVHTLQCTAPKPRVFIQLGQDIKTSSADIKPGQLLSAVGILPGKTHRIMVYEYIQVTVRLLSGESFSKTVEASQTLMQSQLLDSLAFVLNVNVGMIRMTYRGQQVATFATFAELHYREGDDMEVVVVGTSS